MTRQDCSPVGSAMACQGALHGSGAATARGRTAGLDREEASQTMSDRLAESIGQKAGGQKGAGQAVAADEATVRRRRVAAILRAVEGQVVPRLLSAHARRSALPAAEGPGAGSLRADSLGTAGGATVSRGTGGGSGGGADGSGGGADDAAPEARVTREAVLGLAASLLGPNPADAAAACVAGCRAQGIPVEAICLDLLSGTARHLGDLWVEDRCSFTEVTLAAVHLHRLLHAMAPGADGIGRAAGADGGVAGAAAPTGLALLVAAPGEQHSLGLSMLSDFFRGAGWQVQNPAVAGAADAARVVAARPVDLIGFSLGAEVHLPRLAPCVAAVRRASRNRDIIVMVGGPAFLDRPELAIRLGADDTARDAAEALTRAAALLALRRRPPASRRASTARAR